MKKVLLLFILSFSIFNCAFSQNSLVRMWDKRLGGNEAEDLKCMLKTSDDGFILGGTSNSGIGGDKSQVFNDTCNGCIFQGDYWIVKIDSSGIYEWDKTVGGLRADLLEKILLTNDGGYLLAGSSYSGIGADKTTPNWDSTGQSEDYWLIKLDASGTIQWQRDFGGTGWDILRDIKQTSDGGFILAGCSSSGIGGDKSEPIHGGVNDVDYWILKTDSQGFKQWDKSFGALNNDFLYSIVISPDGGYLAGGCSSSPAGGDKSDGNRDSNGVTDDYWIIKFGPSGNKQWDKVIGGSSNDILYRITETQDGGYLLGGISESPVDGDKNESSKGYGDYWLVKVNGSGIKEWDRDIGGPYWEDDFSDIVVCSDGDILLSGTSYSWIGADKTENNLGQEQSWIVKINQQRDIVWDKTIPTPCHEEKSFVIETENCFVIGTSQLSGCETGGYKTVTNWNNSSDFWIVKICDTTHIGISEFSNELDFIAPNPVANELKIHSRWLSGSQFAIGAAITISIYNLLGELAVQPQTLTFKPETVIDVSGLSPGIYWLDIIAEGKTFRTKFVKQ